MNKFTVSGLAALLVLSALSVSFSVQAQNFGSFDQIGQPGHVAPPPVAGQLLNNKQSVASKSDKPSVASPTGSNGIHAAGLVNPGPTDNSH